MDFTATYSPNDNKLRLYSATRLDPETYAKARSLGFRWAPKQKLFVAPKWTPNREDFLLTLVDEIEDEDITPDERAAERAERFEGCSDKRTRDAEAASARVAEIADGIPVGQPILVGHHSERRARKDAERIENGMRKAVNMWKTADYWQDRAAGAVSHARYKELPRVRANRIKTIEADKRRQERSREDFRKKLNFWSAENLTLETARRAANNYLFDFVVIRDSDNYKHRWDASDVLSPDESRYQGCPAWTLEQVREVALRIYPNGIAYCERWLTHYENRLTYERAMLEAQGASDLIAPKPRPKQKPLLNYRAPDGITVLNRWVRGDTMHLAQVEMTKAEYAKIYSDWRYTMDTGNHRVRVFNKSLGERFCVFLTDSKVHKIPTPEVKTTPAPEPDPIMPEPTTCHAPRQAEPRNETREAMEACLKAGVAVAVAPQLFPTPPELAARMIEKAEIKDGHRVLEPSAGTGRLLDPMFNAEGTSWLLGDKGELIAVELNAKLAYALRRQYVAADVINANFLDCTDDLGTFDRILMNPPFVNGSDVQHIKHALKMLKPGGRLVALCANGPRQNSHLRPIADTWEELPAGTFDGTSVRAALLTIDKPA